LETIKTETKLQRKWYMVYRVATFSDLE